MNLYEISAAMNDLFDLADEAIENGADPQVYIDTLESIQMDFEVKAENIIKLIRNLEASQSARMAEIERLESLNHTDERKVDSLKKYLKDMMEATGQKKLQPGIFKITLAANGGKLPIVKNYAEAKELPEQFQRVTIKVEEASDRIREFLDAGGTSPFFSYGERGSHLIIKG